MVSIFKCTCTHTHIIYVQDTIGALDMGGASAQIAFHAPSTIRSEYQATEKLFGKSYAIYARSYLCFGAVEAKRRYLAYLLNVRLLLEPANQPHTRALLLDFVFIIPPVFLLYLAVNCNSHSKPATPRLLKIPVN